jgi:hypothetical protein
VRKLLTVFLLLTATLLAAGCGGGGSSSNSGGGGGGGGGGTGSIATPGPPNVEAVEVDGGPAILTTPPNNQPSINTAFITVQVCVPPGFTTCQTFDHIEIDTGSVGLRILADAADTSGATFNLALPAVTDGMGHPLAECLHFADGDSWGSVNTANISLPISGEKSSQGFNVHVIGASSVGSPPAACIPSPSPPLQEENTVLTFGANGILGVGPFINDCNSEGSCEPGSSAAYYTCTTTAPITCNTAWTATLAQQVPNPVTLFAKDNNGVIIELPAVANNGAASLTNGALVFGIGTENNNALGSATQLLADPQAAFISATLNGQTYPQSYFDSGSNGNFYSSSIATCPSPNNVWYCPSSTLNESATLQGTDGTMATAPFTVANADTLFMDNPTFTVFPGLAGPSAAGCTPQLCSLDLGLPFFFGRNVYTAIEGQTPSAPYFAYISN